jgi:pimeloyl-ACP methyl ester carboxylesterase
VISHDEPHFTAALDEAGPDAGLMGHSSGAIYPLEVANREDVEKLVLYEPPLRWAEAGHPDEMVDRVRALVDAGHPEEAAETFFREEGRLDEDDHAALKALPVWQPMVDWAPLCIREWDAILDAGLSVDRYQDQEMSTPTLLFAGGDNLDHEGMATEALSATLRDVRVSVLDGHRHRAHLTDPTLVANEVRAFLRRD